MSYTYEYPRPAVTADMIVLTDESEPKILSTVIRVVVLSLWLILLMYLRAFQSQVSTMQPKPSGGPSMPFLHLPSITSKYCAML